MDSRKLLTGFLASVSFIASLITISDFIDRRLNHDQKRQDASVTIEAPTQNNPKERTYIGKLWHDAFSEESIPVKERWATRQERFDEVDGVFHRIAFGLFYFPIAGIIILILCCIVSALSALFLLDEKARTIEIILGTIIGFIMAYLVIDGFYSFFVWGLGRIF